MLNKGIWKQGREAELLFWRGWLTGKGKLFEKNIRLHDKFTPFIGNKKKIKIANLGSGPVCIIGNRRRDVEVEVVCSDLLANEYKKLLNSLKLKPICSVEKQNMAKLTYEDNSFDFYRNGNLFPISNYSSFFN